MKRFTLGFLALAMALAITPAALADAYVTGQIGLNLDTATWTSTTPTVVTFRPTDNSIGGKSGAFTAFTSGAFWGAANPYSMATPDEIFLTVNLGSTVATFTIAGPLTGVIVGPGEYVFDATGTISMTGYLDTPGNIIVNINDGGGTYGVDGSSGGITLHADPTPEPSSLLLLGTGLLGLAFIAFRKGKPVLN